MVLKVSEQLNRQNNSVNNYKIWGGVMYNVLVYGLKGDGETNDTDALQDLIDLAISEGRKAIFFPHTPTGGEYYVTSLTNADQVVFFGDNASFVGGYAGLIAQLGDGSNTDRGASVNDFGAKGDGVTDDRASIQYVLDNYKSVWFPSDNYVINGQLLLDTGHVLSGFGTHVNSDTNSDLGNAKLIFTGSGTSAIRNRNMNAMIVHFGLIALSIRATGTYDFIFDFMEPVGMNMHFVRAETTNPAGGVMRTRKLSPANPSWTASMHGTQFRSLDNSTAYIFDTELGDSDIVGCGFTGGKGINLLGTGGMKFTGCLIDRSNGWGITINKATESGTEHLITGNQIEVNTLGGILINGDYNDSLASTVCTPTIVGNMFRNRTDAVDIKFVNTTGPVLTGTLISGNTHAQAVCTPLQYDPTRWTNIVLGPAWTNRSQKKVDIASYGLPYSNQPAIIHANNTPITHTGNTSTTVLKTVVIPAATIGKNGRIKIYVNWSMTGSTNKNLRVHISATDLINESATTELSARHTSDLWNVNSWTAQKASPANAYNNGKTATANTSLALDTLNNSVTISFTTTLSNAADSVTLESILMELYAAD